MTPRQPRDISGRDLVDALRVLGYSTTRHTGSHARLTTERDGTLHVTVPLHESLKVGTLASILREVAAHHGLTRAELLARLFGS